jgi:ABC exporter DevB family membrane fusion protein
MRNLLAIMAAVAVGGVLGLLAEREFGFLRPADRSPASTSGLAGGQTTGSPGAAVPSTVVAPGRIKPAGAVRAISGLPGDRLMELDVKEGKDVRSGEKLAVLESSELRQAELNVATTQLAEAKARQVEEERHAAALLAEARLAQEQVALESRDVDAQRIKVSVLKEQKQTAEDDLGRHEELRKSGDREIVPDQLYESKKLLLTKAQGELGAAETQLTKLEATVELAARQAEAKIATAEAAKSRIPSLVQIKSLEKSVALAETRLKLTTITAPCDGRILKINVHEGETIAQQAILELADPRDMAVLAEIPEEQASLVKRLDRATITAKALHGRSLGGEVQYVGTIVARNPVTPLSPTVPADKHVVEAIIKLDAADVELAASLVDLEVTVTIPGRAGTPAARGAAAAHGGEPVAHLPTSR